MANDRRSSSGWCQRMTVRQGSPVEPIAFWFDFGSPYAYFAAKRLSKGHFVTSDVDWRPVSIGRVFTAHKVPPLRENLVRQTYAERDWQRWSRRLDVSFKLHSVYPVDTRLAGEIYYILKSMDEGIARLYGHLLFERMYEIGEDISCKRVVGEALEAAGADFSVFTKVLDVADNFPCMEEATNKAIVSGVFGSPFFHVGEEAFWGLDAMDAAFEWRTVSDL